MNPPRPRPSAVGQKFHADGTVRHFPGNTIICHLDPSSALIAALIEARDSIQTMDIRRRFALLPPSSYHMTVSEGICDQVRVPERWPSDMPLTATLEEVSAHFADALAGFRHSSPLPFRLKTVPTVPKWGPIVLALEPLGDDENRKLRVLRNRLAAAMRLRTPDHDDYAFHITLAYALDWPDALDEAIAGQIYNRLRKRVDALGPIELGEPEFCHFDTMFAFHRQFYLGG